MLIAIVTSIIIIVGLYFSPNVRNFTENKLLKWMYHIFAVLLILFLPIMVVFPIFDVPIYSASQTGRYLILLGIPVLIFVGIKKIILRQAAAKT